MKCVSDEKKAQSLVSLLRPVQPPCLYPAGYLQAAPSKQHKSMMASDTSFRRLRIFASLILALSGLIVLYHTPYPSLICQNGCSNPWFWLSHIHFPTTTPRTNKPVLLLWFWPESKMFDLRDCGRVFSVDSCFLTDDRSLYSIAMGVLVFHKAIQDDLSNLPTSPRPRFQRWIWFNMDTPSNTNKKEGLQSLFNLTLSYRADADIQVRWRLTAKKKNTNRTFVLPKKERLLCWIVDIKDLLEKSDKRFFYYRELVKHVHVDIFDSSDVVLSTGENYFQTISSCKFYLSFEDSTERDFITERFNGPLAAGTVPVVLGPPRSNYEDFAPGSSFIHVNDFPDVSTLVDHLQSLDKNHTAYMRYFDWRQYYTARRHPTEEKHKFLMAVCQACHYVGNNRDYRAILDLYRWLSE